MGNVLIKSAAVYLSDPGDPDIPPVPSFEGFYEVIDRDVFGIVEWRLNPDYRTPLPGEDLSFAWQSVHNPLYLPIYGTIHVHRVIYHAPSSSREQSPGQPSTMYLNLFHGWNSGATSIDPFEGDRQFQFSLQIQAGIVCGLNDNNRGNDYREIKYGIYAEGINDLLGVGAYRIVEHGVLRSAAVAFNQGDVFTIRRLGDEIAYFQNSLKVYTSLVRTAGPMFADCSMYTAGDAITNARIIPTVAPFNDTAGILIADLGSIDVFAGTDAFNDLIADLGDIGLDLQSHNVGSLTADLGSIGVEAYAGFYSQLTANLGDIGVQAGANTFVPIVNAVGVDLGSLGLYLHGIPGVVGSVAAGLGTIDVQASNYAHSDLIADIGDIGVLAIDTLALNTNSFSVLSGYGFFATASVDNNVTSSQGFHGTLSGYSFTGGTGAAAAARHAGYSFAGTGVAYNVARAAPKLSGYSISGLATPKNFTYAAAELSGYTFIGFTGAVAAITLSGYGVAGAAVPGDSAAVSATHSGYSFAGTIIGINYATALIIGPSYAAVNRSNSSITLSGYGVRATVSISVTLQYEGYSATMLADGTFAITRYSRFPFTQFIRLRNKVYGVGTDGLYELVGDTFDGDPIVANVEWAPTDFRTHQLKRPRSLFVHGKILGASEASVIADQETEEAYSYTPTRIAQGAHRFHFGRGIRAQWLGFRYRNTDGKDFRIDAIEPEVDQLRRTVWG